MLALPQAAKEVGGWQIQNRGTVGGNLCNASPAADGTVALLALDSTVELTSAAPATGVIEQRDLKLSDFVLGNRQTALQPGELLTAIRVPVRSPRAKSAFVKLGHRRYLVISIVMVAAQLDFDEAGRVTFCAIAVGSCSKAALRLSSLEIAMLGTQRFEVVERAQSMLSDALTVLTPIDDVRGTAQYRKTASRELVLKALEQCL